MTEKIKGLVFDIQRYSIHDGPGIRSLVFMKGCPLSCLWCSNPESQSSHQEIMFTPIKCIGCGRCIEVCPTGAAGKKNPLDAQSLCVVCGRCVEVCPSGARRIVGRYMTVDEVMKEVEKDLLFYFSSKGGVTVSGGEPLMQAEFVAMLLKKCREKGIHTAIETCGYGKWEDFEKILKYTDLVLYDIKHIDTQKHRELTGAGNELILENARKISNLNIEMIIRVPVIPGCNDSPENMKAIATLAKSLKVKEVHLLPYHRLGESKYERLGRKYRLKGLSSLDKNDLSEHKKIIESYNLKVEIGG
ncbi:glycyl-radical enzyme activating protein [Candidatus Aerophobetes bacterium]|nr:glycyl-radical enzyme activating protein [Candidatus Aerophobetes bacterium]